MAAVGTLIAVIGWLGAIDVRDTFSASAVSSATGPTASADREAIRGFLEEGKGASGASALVNGGVNAAPATPAKRVVKTSVTRVGGKSYLRVQVTNGYGTAKRFSVKQRVCVKQKCRTVTTGLSVSAGRTAWHETYLGTDTYKKSGSSSVSVTTPPARTTPAPRVTVTVRPTTPAVTTTITVTETVTTTVTTTATATVTATATATVTATVTATPVPPALTPTPSPPLPPSISPTPSVTSTGPLCGAPPNPYGFTFCPAGTKVYPPADGACQVFTCIENFPNGRGYLVMCVDGEVSMSGGLQGVCSSHGGWLRDVNRNAA
ncbi:hypothetical protein [Streptosporangium sp. OZ121]|uniref:hypothetical protein n=1 Tax=Streptosporangium sp. OZ121 TaxID=3444183 RepID=UPI003F793BE2